MFFDFFIIILYLNQTGKKNMHQDLLNRAAGSGQRAQNLEQRAPNFGQRAPNFGQRAAGTQLELRGTYIMTKKMRAKRQAEIRFY